MLKHLQYQVPEKLQHFYLKIEKESEFMIWKSRKKMTMKEIPLAILASQVISILVIKYIFSKYIFCMILDHSIQSSLDHRLMEQLITGKKNHIKNRFCVTTATC